MARESYEYSVEKDDQDKIIYTFDTAQREVYAVTFDPFQYVDKIEAYPYLLNEGVGIAIYKMSEDKHKEDVRVGETILALTGDYIKKITESSIILYHCDYADGKQKHRSIKFRRWFRKSDFYHTYDLMMLDVFDSNTATDHYLGCIIKVDNPNRNQIIMEFINFGNDLNKGKN